MSARWDGFLVTYRRPHELRRSLERLLKQSLPPEYLLVVDNDPDRSAQAVARDISTGRVAYLSLPQNPGPAGAAAAALEHLLERDGPWLYWGDDDDPPEAPDTLERLLQLESSTSGQPVGALAASGVRWDWRTGRPMRVPDEELQGAIGIDAVGGGMQLVLRREAVQRVGLPNPRLFFGLEDYEYCLRLRSAGYAILADGDRMWERRARQGRLGYVPHRRATPSGSLRSLPREYYTTRNYVYLMRHTFNRPGLAHRRTLRSLFRIVSSWLRGPRFGWAFTRVELRALWDGYREHMGRTLSLGESKP